MSRERRKEIIEAVGITAIAASLLFLAFEIQQSNRIAIASTEIGIRNGYSEFNRGIYSGSSVAEIVAMAEDPGVEWSSTEELKMLMVVTDLTNVWLTVETACDNGLALATTCAELGDDIRAFIAMFPGTRKLWHFILDSYPSPVSTEVFVTIRLALEK